MGYPGVAENVKQIMKSDSEFFLIDISIKYIIMLSFVNIMKALK